VMDMNARDISCSIICVHDPASLGPIERYHFGVVPDFEALSFLCASTGGTFTHARAEGLRHKLGVDFLLATETELARLVKHKSMREQLGSINDWAANEQSRRGLRQSIFVRCASLDGKR
jgi:hypothetical protein